MSTGKGCLVLHLTIIGRHKLQPAASLAGPANVLSAPAIGLSVSAGGLSFTAVCMTMAAYNLNCPAKCLTVADTYLPVAADNPVAPACDLSGPVNGRTQKSKPIIICLT